MPQSTINVREYRSAKSKMETLTTYGTQDEVKQNKNLAQYLLDSSIYIELHCRIPSQADYNIPKTRYIASIV